MCTTIFFIYGCIQILKKIINCEPVGAVYINDLSSDKYQVVWLCSGEFIKKNIRKFIIDKVALRLVSSYECKLNL